MSRPRVLPSDLHDPCSSQVSARSGVFYGVDANPGGEAPSLTVLKSVRCLECGAVYSKPAGGGTVRQNPGCPDCGYVGWVAINAPLFGAWRLHHSAEDRLRQRGG
jgi:hypothetical protein